MLKVTNIEYRNGSKITNDMKRRLVADIRMLLNRYGITALIYYNWGDVCER